MKSLTNTLLVVAGIIVVIAIISRLSLKPLWVGIQAEACLQFAQTLFLAVIALAVTK